MISTIEVRYEYRLPIQSVWTNGTNEVVSRYPEAARPTSLSDAVGFLDEMLKRTHWSPRYQYRVRKVHTVEFTSPIREYSNGVPRNVQG